MQEFASYQSWAEAATRLQDEPYEVLKKIQNIPSASFDSFLQCPSCKLIQSSPLPNESTLSTYYTDESELVDFDLRVTRCIKRARTNINLLKKIVFGESFLDVGCGVGGAAYTAHLAGFKSTGIDLDNRALEEASKRFPECSFLYYQIQQFAKEEKQFDLIYASEIIEHVPDVNSFVKTLAQLTKHNGHLFITTPKVSRKMLINARDFVEWNLVGPPEHLFYFTQLNLKKLLEKNGFEVIKFFTPIKSSLRVLAKRIASKD